MAIERGKRTDLAHTQQLGLIHYQATNLQRTPELKLTHRKRIKDNQANAYNMTQVDNGLALTNTQQVHHQQVGVQVSWPR